MAGRGLWIPPCGGAGCSVGCVVPRRVVQQLTEDAEGRPREETANGINNEIAVAGVDIAPEVR